MKSDRYFIYLKPLRKMKNIAESVFTDFDLSDFWEDSEYALRVYVSQPTTSELIISIEDELGYKLPPSCLELMKNHNGGIPKNCCFPTKERTSWAENHVAIAGILGIGRDKTYSLCGELGSQFMIVFMTNHLKHNNSGAQEQVQVIDTMRKFSASGEQEWWSFFVYLLYENSLNLQN